jgi:hypothetical protein
MKSKFIVGSLLALAIFSLLGSNASAEKINIDEAYYEKNLIGQCIFGFSRERNERVKILFESKTSARYLTESFLDAKQEISLADGNIIAKNPRGSFSIRLDNKDGKSFSRDAKKAERDEVQVFLGPCETPYSKMNTLPALPSALSVSSTATVKVEKDEIAALEKKLAALKQKAARKEEYQKMRALLDQKLKELQGQIQMLEQEYKDVLN